MKITRLLFLVLCAQSIASEAVRMEAMGWLKESTSEQSRELGIGEMSIRVTVFNDGKDPITLPSLILNNAETWNSLGSPALVLTYRPNTYLARSQKKYTVVPSREAFAPVIIRPGECAYVKLEGFVPWPTKNSSNSTSVALRTTGFLSERLGFTAVDLVSPLEIVDQRPTARRAKLTPMADRQWLQVDEGFQFQIPSNWRDKEARGIDSHVGRYEGPRAYLEFDELFGLGQTVGRSREAIDKLARKEADRKLLSPGEEIWRVDGRLAQFKVAKVDPAVFGKREHPNVASLFVPYEGAAGYLSIHVLYADEDYLPTVRRILSSFKWPKEAARE